LAALPLELRLRGKSTTQSHRAPIYYVDLTERAGMSMSAMLESATAEVKTRRAMGFDQRALDEAARLGLAEGDFEDSAEDQGWIVEEFAFALPPTVDHEINEKSPSATLMQKLQQKVQSSIQ